MAASMHDGPLLIASSLPAFGLAMASPLSPWLGFMPVPGLMLGTLAVLTLTYLFAVYGVKRWFFTRHQVG